jgi:alanine racemase
MIRAARAVARVDLEAVETNVARIRLTLPRAELCAVVKADGYGHGAVPCAMAAQAGGATWLAVVTGGEALVLREGGLSGRILAMGALDQDELDRALAADADVAAWSPSFVECLGDRDARVHVKLDTGLGRLGTRDMSAADSLVRQLAERAAGLWTHFATADDPDSAFFGEQLRRFSDWAFPHKARRPDLLLHAANSAATLRDSATHFDMVRCGGAIYGLDPFGSDAHRHGLVPAMSVQSYVAAVKPCNAGEGSGYGRRFVAAAPTQLATLPIGYGDGWPRALGEGGDVIIRDRRYPLVGSVSMDNLTVDVGIETDVRPGDLAMLLGSGITAEELGRRAETINYDITTGLLPRTARVYHRRSRRLASRALG